MVLLYVKIYKAILFMVAKKKGDGYAGLQGVLW